MSFNHSALCEYGRCGTIGKSEAKRKWRARVTVTVGERVWRVCESCADLLLRDARPRDTAPRGFEKVSPALVTKVLGITVAKEKEQNGR